MGGAGSAADRGHPATAAEGLHYVENAKSYFGPDASPGRRWLDLFVRRHPTLKPVKPSSLEASRSKAASPEAVAKTFGALSFLAEKLHTGKGTAAAHRAIHMPTLVARLKPEALRQLEEVTWAHGSISNSGKAVLANSEAVTKAINEKLRADADKAKAAARKAADKQQRSENRAREALITRDRRARGPIKTVHKKRMLAGAQRQRMRVGLAEFS